MVSASSVINALGRVLVGVGLVVLSFAAFQLWGTSLAEAKAQDELGAEFEAMLDSVNSDAVIGGQAQDVSDLVDSDTKSQVAPVVEPFVRNVEADELPELGEASGRLYIPTLGVEKTIVHGVARDDLRLGPGHYPDTAWPGQTGNAAIAGHRTTHGSPFLELDQLSPGDNIYVHTVQGLFKYEVQEHEDRWGHPQGHFIVDPHQVDVLEDFGDNRLTLTACHPRYSAAKRLIVTATLVSEPAPVLDASDPTDGPAPIDEDLGSELADELYAAEASDLAYADSGLGNGAQQREGASGSESQSVPDDSDSLNSDVPGNSIDGSTAADSVDQPTTVAESLGWQPQHWPLTAAWSALTALVLTVAWLMGRRWRKLPSYALAAAPFLYCLFWTFTFLDKMLPAV